MRIDIVVIKRLVVVKVEVCGFSAVVDVNTVVIDEIIDDELEVSELFEDMTVELDNIVEDGVVIGAKVVVWSEVLVSFEVTVDESPEEIIALVVGVVVWFNVDVKGVVGTVDESA